MLKGTKLKNKIFIKIKYINQLEKNIHFATSITQWNSYLELGNEKTIKVNDKFYEKIRLLY
jgi:hypothetical protein